MEPSKTDRSDIPDGVKITASEEAAPRILTTEEAPYDPPSATGQSDSPVAPPQADPPVGTDRPTLESVTEQLPLPRVLKDWLICVRKPALSLRYRMEKRHIPDLDADGAGKSDGTAPDPTGSNTDSRHAASPKGASPASQGGETAPAAQDSSRAPVCHKGQNTDLMTVTGGFTIRYFDLAAGMLGILLAGCLLRGCCWVRRKMK